MTGLETRLAAVLNLHFDPRWGSPYWLERAAGLDFDPRRDIHSVSELRRFGPMPLEELSRRPVEDFIPRKFHGRLAEFITSETGGTTGRPKRTAYLPDEFAAGFVTPFVEAAKLVGFPRDVHWLYIGPSGPHIIGKAARACATTMGSIDPFMVDFDPRWALKLAPGSMARRRYLEHVVEQALAVLGTQRVGVLFATPPVVEALGARAPEALRRAITGIHLGGMAGGIAFWRSLRGAWFPNAVVLSGYGNSLAGMCPQVECAPDRAPAYFAHGTRLVVETEANRPNDRSPVVFHRLDESGFLPYVVERDVAALAPLPDQARHTDFHPVGLLDPTPHADTPHGQTGLY